MDNKKLRCGIYAYTEIKTKRKNYEKKLLILQLATHKNAIGVVLGATIEHATCMLLAVVGRKHAHIQDLTTHSCYNWSVSFP